MPTVTERFLAAIRRSGLTKAQMAQQTGLSRGQISDIVNGKRSPTLETVDRIAAVIGWPEEFGVLSICKVSKSSSIVMEAFWWFPKPRKELLDEDPDLYFELASRVLRQNPTYAPGAFLRWRRVEGPMPKDEAEMALDRLMADRSIVAGEPDRADMIAGGGVRKERRRSRTSKKGGDKPSE